MQLMRDVLGLIFCEGPNVDDDTEQINVELECLISRPSVISGKTNLKSVFN